MRVLWITARPIAGTCGTANASTSGSWLDAAYDSCKNNDNLEIIIASLGKTDEIKEFNEGKHRFFLIPQYDANHYDIKKKKNIENWQALKETINPDLIQIWGTERSVYLLTRQIFSNIPCVVYIQGVVTKVAEDYYGGVSESIRRRYISLQDIYRGTSMTMIQKQFEKTAKMEQELIRKSDAVIVENDWCEDQMLAIAPNIKVYRSKLPIKDDFFKQNWELENIERHTLFSNAGSAPLKGHHVLFKALSIVAKQYPDVKLYVPGFARMSNRFVDRIGRSGYMNYLMSLIKKYNLYKNIEYLGVLTSEQMAETISKKHVFVMPSSIENHSSSMIEAMVVGVPCVCSYVGGVNSVAVHKHNAYLYNYSDAQALAGCIIRLFKSDDEAVRLSSNAKQQREERKVNICADFMKIYAELLN